MNWVSEMRTNTITIDSREFVIEFPTYRVWEKTEKGLSLIVSETLANAIVCEYWNPSTKYNGD